MTQEAIKLELIEWLTKLQSNETIHYLKIIKDSMKEENDWWSSLSSEQISGIERGLKDIDEGRTIAHETVKQRYGL
jgi:predicted transcriptional regulator